MDKHLLLLKLPLKCKIVVHILSENDKDAVMTQLVLHQAKKEEEPWSVALGQNISRAIYVKVSIESLIAYLFCDVKQSEASESQKNKIIVILHGDAIGHHPKTTMITLKFMSYDKRRVFRNGARVSEVLPAIIAVGSDTQSRRYFREVLQEVVDFTSHDLKVRGGSRGEKTLTFQFAKRILMIMDRNVAYMCAGAPIPKMASAVIYSVTLFYSCNFLLCYWWIVCVFVRQSLEMNFTNCLWLMNHNLQTSILKKDMK